MIVDGLRYLSAGGQRITPAQYVVLSALVEATVFEVLKGHVVSAAGANQAWAHIQRCGPEALRVVYYPKLEALYGVASMCPLLDGPGVVNVLQSSRTYREASSAT